MLESPRQKLTNIMGLNALKKELFENGDITLTADELSSLLDAVGVTVSIDNLLLVLDNFARSATLIVNICKTPKWVVFAEQFYDLTTTATDILSVRQQLYRRIKLLEAPTSKQNKNVFRGLTESAPLYATIGHLPADLQFLQQYDQLIAQTLVAQQIGIANGQLKKQQHLFTAALSAIRSLAIKKSKTLQNLPSELLQPPDYLKRLRTLRLTDNLRQICTFLAVMQGSMVTNTIDTLGHSLNDDERQATIHPINRPLDITKCRSIEVYTDDNLPEDELQPASPGVLCLSPQGAHGNFSANELQLISEQIAHSIAMENQSFANAWNTISHYDIKILLHEIFRPPNTQENTQSDDITAEQLTTKVILGLMLFAGLSAKKICQLQICFDHSAATATATTSATDDEYDATNNCYFYTDKTLRLASHGPEYKTQLSPQAAEQTYPLQQFIDLELPAPLTDLIRQFVRIDHRDTIQQNGNFIDWSHNKINSCVKSLFSKLRNNHQTHLNLTKVQNYLTGVTSRIDGSDHAIASLIFGKELSLARTKIYYATFDSDTLQRFHRQACQQVLQTGGFTSTISDRYPLANNYLGAKIRPTVATVTALASQLQSRLQLRVKHFASVTELADYHNAYTLYTWLILAYSSGYRGINVPYLRGDMIDERSGFSVIRDKDSTDFYHSRLVWLPKICRAQLSHYRHHVEQVLALSQEGAPADSDQFFFIDPDNGAYVYARSSQIKQQLHSFGYHLPSNAQRHFLKSELQEDGCSVEAIELFLGHWDLGLEGWVATSSLSPLDYRDEIQRYLEPLLHRIGLTPIIGLKSPPTKLSLPITKQAITTGNGSASGKASRAAVPNKQLGILLDTTPPAAVWFDQLGAIFQQQAASQAFNTQQQIVLNLLLKHLPELYHGQVDTVVTEEELKNFVRLLKAKDQPVKTLYKRLCFFIAALERGKKELGWQMTVPLYTLILPKSKNRISPKVIRHTLGYRQVEQIFITDLEAPLSTNPLVQLGQIMVSAMLYGGITHQVWAEALLKGLCNQWCYQWQEILWVDLWTIDRPASTNEQWLLQRNSSHYRRWLTDPLTQLLLLRWRNDGDNQLTQTLNINTVYKHYTRHIRQSHGYTMPSLSNLLYYANGWSTLHLPPFLSAYQENQVSSTSLPDPVWLRMLSGDNYPAIYRSRSLTTTERIKGQQLVYADQLDLIKQLRSGIKARATEQKKEIIHWITSFATANQSFLSSAALLLVDWSIQMLSPRQSVQEQRQKKPEQPSTVINYLGTFYKEFLTTAQNLELADLDEDELQALFSEVVNHIKVFKDIDNASDFGLNRINYVVDRLNQFLAFIHLFHSLPEFSIVLTGNSPQVKHQVAVRANLVTVNEFNRLKTILGWQVTNLSRNKRMALVWAILAFRAGLRVGEISGLLIQDLQGDEHLELLVTRNHLRDLKSTASQRRIPLYALLPPDELAFVTQWHTFRKTELGATPKAALFSNLPQEVLPCSRNRLLKIIAPALKHVTGDQNIVMHSLRHSFASWMLVGLLQRDDSDFKTEPEFLKCAELSPAHSKQLKTTLLANEALGRKGLFVTAGLLGHADTQTLLTSYMHLSDWLCWHHLRHPACAPPLTAEAVAQITGCSKASGYRILKHSGHYLTQVLNKTPAQQHYPPHPLTTTAIAPVNIKKVAQQKRQFNFDEKLHIVYNQQPQLRWPKTANEVRILQHWHHQLCQQTQTRTLRTSAKLLLAAHRDYNHNFIFEDIAAAQKAIKLLQQLGGNLKLRHYPSRWHDKQQTTQGYQQWRQQLDLHIGRGYNTSGTNTQYGILNVQVMNLRINNLQVDNDKILQHLLVNLLQLLSG